MRSCGQATRGGNYGSQTILRSATDMISYLRFDVQNLDGPVASATLRLYVMDTNSDGFSVHGVTDTTWSESAVTYSNAPAVGSLIDSHGSTTADSWLEIDVTSYVNTEGLYSLALTSSTVDRLRWRSREHSNNPELVIETGSATETPTATAGDATATPSPTNTPTSTPTSTLTPTFTATATATPSPTYTATPGATLTPSVTPLPGDIFFFTPEADAFVWEGSLTNNYGAQTILRSAADMTSYLRFNVQDLDGPVTAATLRLFPLDTNGDGFSVNSVLDNSWAELGITADNAPAIGSAVGSYGATTADTWIEIDVTGYVNGDGALSLALVSETSGVLRFRSREHTNMPELVVETGAAPTPTPTFMPTATAPANQTPVAVNDEAITAIDSPITIDVLANDFDPDEDPLVVDEISQPSYGSAALNPDYTVIYTPTLGYSGADSFTYTISDGHGGFAVGAIDIEIYAPGVAVSLQTYISPTIAFAGEEVLALTVEALDAAGNLATGYRGGIEFVESASSTLPSRQPGCCGNFPDYTFTEADAGRAMLTFAFNAAGVQNVYVYELGNSSLNDTTNDVTIREVFLSTWITPTVGIAGDEVFTLTVEAHDENGSLWPDYRGGIEFVESASSTLPSHQPGCCGNFPDYTFTEADAGRAVLTFAFNVAGIQNVYIYDHANNNRNATTNDVTVKEVYLTASITPTVGIARDRVFTLTVEARDENGELWPGYRGGIEFVESASSTLPAAHPPCCGNFADYIFTEADAGRASFNFAFNETGSHHVYIYDHANESRNATSNSVEVTEPPPPTPAPPGPPASSYTVSPTLKSNLPPPIPYHWGMPFAAHDDYLESNEWRGYPDYAVPTGEGALYLVSGFAHWRSAGPLSTAYQVCPYLGWENPMTEERASGGGLDGGPMGSNKHPSTIGFGLAYCSSYTQGPLPLGLKLSDPAPAAAEGLHLDLHGGGNSAGYVLVSANGDFGGHECDTPEESISVGDPIDTRSGAFYMTERDFGVETGCQGIDLHFERSYSSISVASSVFGHGWTHNYNQEIIVLNATYVAVRRPRGSYQIYQDVGGDVYATRPGAKHTLVKRAEGGWALVRDDRHVDLFDADGRLVAQQDPNGNLVWLTYESYERDGQSGTRLARVDAPGGRFLWFGYDYYNPTVLTQVADHTGRTVHYATNELGFLNVVTDTLGAATTYQYDGLLLASQVDPLGNIVFSNQYDEGGRVITQTNNLGQHLSLSYVTAGDGITTTVRENNTGAVTTYAYWSDGLLRQVTDPLGAVTHYGDYDETRFAGEIEDALGNVTQIQHDDRGRPVAVSDALGGTVQIAYDHWSNPLIITDTVGRTYHFAYDGPNLTEATDPAGQTLTFHYEDQAGWKNVLAGVTNQAGVTTTLSYDAAGDIIQIINALQGTTALDYDELGRLIATTDALGHTTTFGYDAGNRLITITDALSNTVHYEYDALGNLLRISDQIDAVTVMTYTRGILPSAITDALSGTVTVEYDAVGRPVLLTDQLGQSSVVEYDLVGRPVAVTDALGNTTEIGYDALGNTTVITDANGHALRIEYDLLSRPIVLRNALNQTITYTYDTAGNVVAITDAAGESVGIGYDLLDRPVVITDQLGITTTYQYNALDLVTDFVDGNGVTTHYVYDALGQLTEVIGNFRPGLPAGADTNVRTGYAYDAVGNLLNVTDPRNYVTHFAYDPVGNLLSVTDPLSRTMSYEYDPRGLLESWYKADGSEISYDYDLLGRLTGIIAPDRAINYLYDAAGRRTGMGDAEGFTGYEYDAVGRPLTITLPGGQAVGYGYDHVGNRTQLTYPDGKTVQVGYNEINQVVSVTDWDGQETTFSYDTAGRPAQIGLPNGVTSTLTYDAAGNLLSLTHAPITGTIGSYTYTYDESGRRVGAIDNGQVITYTYDALYRLIEARESGGDLYQYSYDAAGNRLSKIEPGETVTATHDAANQLLTLNGLPVSYDANGNLLHDGVFTYTYNSLDQLIAVSDGITTTQYGYNGDGDRLWQNTDGVTTTFTLDLNTALAQVLAQTQNGATAFYLPGIGQEVNGVWSYFHTDALGSVRHISDPAGQVLGQIRYTPFGEVVGQSGLAAPFGFTGEPQDAETALVYLRARHYSPRLGRFLTQDPFPGFLHLPATLHSYQYALNDPLNLTDPSGEIPPLLLAAGIGAGIGGAMGGIHYMLSLDQPQPAGDGCCGAATSNEFQWSGFGRAVGIGAVSGAVGGLVGFAVPMILPATASLQSVVATGVVAGTASGGAEQIVFNLLAQCREWHENLAQAMIIGGVTGGIGAGYHSGKELRLGNNFRIAPFGNRTGHPTGRYPHYHRRVVDPVTGEPTPGQGLKRHRPWDTKSPDRRFWDRF